MVAESFVSFSISTDLLFSSSKVAASVIFSLESFSSSAWVCSSKIFALDILSPCCILSLIVSACFSIFEISAAVFSSDCESSASRFSSNDIHSSIGNSLFLAFETCTQCSEDSSQFIPAIYCVMLCLICKQLLSRDEASCFNLF